MLPEIVTGDLILSKLISVKNLVLPKKLGGSLSLDSLKTTECLVLPEEIEGKLYLQSLVNQGSLVIPESLDLDKLIVNDKIKKEIINNPEKYYKENSNNISEITYKKYR